MPNTRVADARKTNLQRRPCGIIRIAALCPLCRYRHKGHWTSHETRLNRNLGKRFGDDTYAMEQLVAELGAAFLCADLGVSNSPRPDHAAYIADWLAVLKRDSKAPLTAAAKAASAAEYLFKLQVLAREAAKSPPASTP
jgi:antirestriction protein ArdC